MNNEVKKIKRDNYNCEECVIVPSTDILEDENNFTLRADMPGVKKEDLEITLTEGNLEIHAKAVNINEDDEYLKYQEFSENNYHRSFKVGREIDGSKISAALEKGVLTLNLPKHEKLKPKKIEVKTVA